MSFWTLTLIAVGVSADAFAVAVGKGLTMPRLSRRGAVLIAVMFGAFQGVMPLIGWLLGSGLEGSIERIDHWIAFGLLVAVGAKMLHEALLGDDAAEQDEVLPVRERVAAGGPAPTGDLLPLARRRRQSVPVRELTLLSVATSVDALAVGISFAFLEVSIGPAVMLIALVTFALSLTGVAVGRAAGARWRRPAEVCGGLILIGIGTKILLEHLQLL